MNLKLLSLIVSTLVFSNLYASEVKTFECQLTTSLKNRHSSTQILGTKQFKVHAFHKEKTFETIGIQVESDKILPLTVKEVNLEPISKKPEHVYYPYIATIEFERLSQRDIKKLLASYDMDVKSTAITHSVKFKSLYTLRGISYWDGEKTDELINNDEEKGSTSFISNNETNQVQLKIKCDPYIVIE